jgi:hypothetical protein
MSESILQELLDHRAILELKARFVRTVDAKDWVGYREVFSTDGIFDFGGAYVVRGGDAFVAAVAGQLEGAISVHRAFLPEVVFVSASEARGEWAVNDYIEWKPDPISGERRGFMGFGREYESYLKINGAWKIAHWRVHYDRMDPLPRAQLPDRILGGPEVLRDPEYIGAVTARN